MTRRAGPAQSQDHDGTGNAELQNSRHGSEGAVGLSIGAQLDPAAHGAIGINRGLSATPAELQAHPATVACLATI